MIKTENISDNVLKITAPEKFTLSWIKRGLWLMEEPE